MKKIDKLILSSFIPPFIAAFFIAIFVLMMQFLWLWIDDLIGKGVSIWVIFELLGYLLVTFIPMAIPIAILIAGVMVFGALGENYELSSMKSAGISLLRIMRMAIIIGVALGIFSYFSANYIIPEANLKYKARLFDIKKQKPTLSIEPGIFNYDFQGYTIRVTDKAANDRDLKNVLIYDNTQSSPSKVNLIHAERGEMYVSDNERFMIMRLFDGYQVQEAEKVTESSTRPTFTRSVFEEWEKVFDLSEFEISKTDEELFKNHQSMLSGKLLKQAIDTIDMKMNEQTLRSQKDMKYDLPRWYDLESGDPIIKDRQDRQVQFQLPPNQEGLAAFAQKDSVNLLIDESMSFFDLFERVALENLLPFTRTKIMDMRSRFSISSSSLKSSSEQRSKHVFEYHQKFVFGVVCIIFLFIGVSLGAIVRKGGFGYPLLIAIIFFMIHISATTTFKKLAETQKMNDILASWGSCLVLLPFAIWFTYKAQLDAKFIDIGYLFKRILSFVIPSKK